MLELPFVKGHGIYLLQRAGACISFDAHHTKLFTPWGRLQLCHFGPAFTPCSSNGAQSVESSKKNETKQIDSRLERACIASCLSKRLKLSLRENHEARNNEIRPQAELNRLKQTISVDMTPDSLQDVGTYLEPSCAAEIEKHNETDTLFIGDKTIFYDIKTIDGIPVPNVQFHDFKITDELINYLWFDKDVLHSLGIEYVDYDETKKGEFEKMNDRFNQFCEKSKQQYAEFLDEHKK